MEIRDRLADLDWKAIGRSLDDWGYAKIPPVLTPDECAALISLWPDTDRFRSRIDMARYRFGEGEYKYFAHPLPPIVETLRSVAYPPIAAIANRWQEALRSRARYPDDLAALLERCRRKGQTRPTPLMLRYEAGGYNCLHQDVYGEVVFPIQLTCFLSRRSVDYTGGDFLLVEQRPRPVARRVHRHGAGRDGDLHDARPPGTRRAGRLSRTDAPWRQSAPLGPALDARRDLPRRAVARRCLCRNGPWSSVSAASSNEKCSAIPPSS